MKNTGVRTPMAGEKKLNAGMIILVAALVIGGVFVGLFISGMKAETKTAGKNSTFVIDYTLGVIDPGNQGIRVIQTTDRQTAIDTNMYSPFNSYNPINITVGSPGILPAFSEQIAGMKAGEEKTFAIVPENAYGKYDSELVKSFPLSAINATQLRVGSRITSDIGVGTVVALDADKAAIDFNHPLAGLTLVYKVRVVRIA